MEPLAKGSLSLRLYPHLDRPAPDVVAELRSQAALAGEHGFDGVMTSEHHNGFYGYIPNPLQVAGWLLEAMPEGWAAACREMARRGDDVLIDHAAPSLSIWDEGEWEW